MGDGGNIFQRITTEYYHFTASERKIADYVLAHKNQVQYMSISELSDEIDVSEATISRYCKSMGLQSYNAFKLSLAESTAMSPRVEVREEQSELDQLVREFIGNYNYALNQGAEFLQEKMIGKAVQTLIEARLVLCMGQGGSMIPARAAAHLMSTISTKFFPVEDSHNQAMRCSLLEEGDVVLFFSYSGATVEIVDLIKMAKKRGAKVILITRFSKSPGAKKADIVLQCGSDEGPLQLSSMTALIAELFLLDILYHEYCRMQPEDTLSNKELVADAVSERHI